MQRIHWDVEFAEAPLSSRSGRIPFLHSYIATYLQEVVLPLDTTQVKLGMIQKWHM